jgi:hypothetical protein
MKIIHLQGFQDEERKKVRGVIYANVISYMQILLEQSVKFDLSIKEENQGYKEIIEKITKEELEQPQELRLTPELSQAITALWQDPTISGDVMKRNSEFQLSDSAE